MIQPKHKLKRLGYPAGDGTGKLELVDQRNR